MVRKKKRRKSNSGGLISKIEKIRGYKTYVRSVSRRNRVLNWFKHHPQEVRHLKEYRILSSSDYHYLSRRPGGYRNLRRIGTDIGAVGHRLSGVTYYVYLVRVKKV